MKLNSVGCIFSASWFDIVGNISNVTKRSSQPPPPLFPCGIELLQQNPQTPNLRPSFGQLYNGRKRKGA